MNADMVAGASRITLAALVPAALLGGLLADWPGAVGVLAGGGLSLGSLHALTRAARAAVTRPAGRSSRLWMGAACLRYVLLFGAIALLLATGAAHPLALLAGLSLLPPILIGHGLRAARTGV
ncbi:MAG TPA: ATP synthase subunit I [Methylomirabilota bacterium]|nr:ATP synthase subunit I [Methylomirabilota bacterium]